MEKKTMIKRARFCLFCQQVGLTETFKTGNELRKHVAVNHPRSKAQKSADRTKLREYRREVLLVLARKSRP